MTGQVGLQVQRWLTTSRPSPGSKRVRSSWRVGPKSWSKEMRRVSAKWSARKAMAAGALSKTAIFAEGRRVARTVRMAVTREGSSSRRRTYTRGILIEDAHGLEARDTGEKNTGW